MKFLKAAIWQNYLIIYHYGEIPDLWQLQWVFNDVPSHQDVKVHYFETNPFGDIMKLECRKIWARVLKLSAKVGWLAHMLFLRSVQNPWLVNSSGIILSHIIWPYIYIGDCHSPFEESQSTKIAGVERFQLAIVMTTTCCSFQIVIHTDGGAGPPNFSV